ncbi:MBL fold metallo-hydrolase [Vibrio vulnificus]|uniref:MBL fold metallo-hydrolase n=1 Tax=Vibrio vulnificus TaxID=672 RepID=UPI0009BEB35F|nr:hydrolase [Vibrio vulnificus]EGR0235638.1 hydrolase [Vibrio vulnificus]HAS8183844.1 hydrolase [Vibrio vulnificus]HAS8187524.1 hydrolase [Vibrio vulnificus]HAS8228725.1 hydrolase [Vibrio vulnificus]
MNKRLIKITFLTVLGAIAMSSIFTACSTAEAEKSLHPKTFRNSDPNFNGGSDLFEIVKAYFTTKRAVPKPTFALPVHSITTEQLLEEQQDVLYRLGHSSVLMKLDGQLVMTDPVFSKRASPVQFFGPARFHPTPIELDGLPNIDVVLISHDHYDHLDKNTVKTLASKVGVFLVPLKVGVILQEWGVDKHKIVEFNWWESHVVNGIEYVFTPTQHFSGRGLTDSNSTLWGSWVIRGREKNLFFSGDSGYFDGFKTIGEKYGPFDLTMIETGAYNSLWSNIHMFPEESVQAHLDLQGQKMMPIHNSTFDLAMHDWHEPMEKARQISEEKGVTMISPEIGQRLVLNEESPLKPWWLEDNG